VGSSARKSSGGGAGCGMSGIVMSEVEFFLQSVHFVVRVFRKNLKVWERVAD
jgi:hypothetical protein